MELTEWELFTNLAGSLGKRVPRLEFMLGDCENYDRLRRLLTHSLLAGRRHMLAYNRLYHDVRYTGFRPTAIASEARIAGYGQHAARMLCYYRLCFAVADRMADMEQNGEQRDPFYEPYSLPSPLSHSHVVSFFRRPPDVAFGGKAYPRGRVSHLGWR